MIQAQQFFSGTSSEYKNVIFIGDYPLVQVLGTYKCPGKKKLEFEVNGFKFGPFKFGAKGGGQGGFFTMFFVDDKIAVARGLSGGLAFWSKVG